MPSAALSLARSLAERLAEAAEQPSAQQPAAPAAPLSAASNPQAWIPPEALVTFHLTEPVTVDPVNREQAMRLSQGLYQGGPQLYQRRGYNYYAGPYPYAYPVGYYPYGGYPPVYYRPYYIAGGYYYWR